MSAGIPISGLEIARRRTYRGARHSYVNARCETGRLRVRGEFTFDDDTDLRAKFSRRCSLRG
jgi:hypothetical protein